MVKAVTARLIAVPQQSVGLESDEVNGVRFLRAAPDGVAPSSSHTTCRKRPRFSSKPGSFALSSTILHTPSTDTHGGCRATRDIGHKALPVWPMAYVAQGILWLMPKGIPY